VGRENGKFSKVELKKAMDKMHPFIHLRKSLFDEMKIFKFLKRDGEKWMICKNLCCKHDECNSSVIQLALGRQHF
jgi:hypothetical protein